MTGQKFKCKSCKKEVVENSFPYKAGWKYVYRFEWKSDSEIQEKVIDLHFCSEKCLIKFIKDLKI